MLVFQDTDALNPSKLPWVLCQAMSWPFTIRREQSFCPRTTPSHTQSPQKRRKGLHPRVLLEPIFGSLSFLILRWTTLKLSRLRSAAETMHPPHLYDLILCPLGPFPKGPHRVLEVRSWKNGEHARHKDDIQTGSKCTHPNGTQV